VPRRVIAIALVVAAAILGGTACGGSDEPASPTTSIAPTTTTLPTGPTRVLFLGDSVLFDASPALEAAFQATGATTFAQGALGSGLLRTDAYDWRVQWPLLIAEHRPDLVVVLTGAWDLLTDDAGTAAWAARVRAAADEVIGLAAAARAKALWLGFPRVREAEADRLIPRLNELLGEALRAAGPDAFYVDSTSALGGGDASAYVESEAGVRIRKMDGRHLCPEGARRLAAAALAAASAWWQVPPATAGWQTGSWQADERYSPTAGCTPA
jgi:hypothetical protein